MNLNLIHDYIETVYAFEHRNDREQTLQLVMNMNRAWAKLNREEQDEASRLCELKGL